MMIIRPFKTQDFDRLLILAEEMRQESPRFNPFELNKTKLLALGNDTIKHPNLYFGRVALAEYVTESDTIIGFMIGFCTEHYFSNGKLAADMAIYVIPEERGGRAAMALIRAFERWASENDADEITLGISAEIEPKRVAELYSRLGFEECGTLCKKRLWPSP